MPLSSHQQKEKEIIPPSALTSTSELSPHMAGDLSGVEPGHTENQTLVSTDINMSTAFIKKKNTSHNTTACMHKLFKCCEQIGCCNDEDQ
jgi:hypothetical protein